jgi:hypothetical protein
MASGPDTSTEAFLAHRNLLFTVAYEMLGSAADAEDVLQETWLRWAGVDIDTVENQRAYLVQVTTRQALGRLRTLGRRKESYVGPWLPEPLLTAPDVAEDVNWPTASRWRCCWCWRDSRRPSGQCSCCAIVRFDGEIDTVLALRIDDGLITGLYAVRNPAKLSHMQRETALRR